MDVTYSIFSDGQADYSDEPVLLGLAIVIWE